jgi:hypothetical protein
VKLNAVLPTNVFLNKRVTSKLRQEIMFLGEVEIESGGQKPEVKLLDNFSLFPPTPNFIKAVYELSTYFMRTDRMTKMQPFLTGTSQVRERGHKDTVRGKVKYKVFLIL